MNVKDAGALLSTIHSTLMELASADMQEAMSLDVQET